MNQPQTPDVDVLLTAMAEALALKIPGAASLIDQVRNLQPVRALRSEAEAERLAHRTAQIARLSEIKQGADERMAKFHGATAVAEKRLAEARDALHKAAQAHSEAFSAGLAASMRLEREVTNIERDLRSSADHRLPAFMSMMTDVIHASRHLARVTHAETIVTVAGNRRTVEHSNAGPIGDLMALCGELRREAEAMQLQALPHDAVTSWLEESCLAVNSFVASVEASNTVGELWLNAAAMPVRGNSPAHAAH